MKRRDFLSMTAAASAALWLPRAFGAQAPGQADGAALARGGYGNLLILVELKGGNDGLNTVIPYADPTYYQLRKNIGIKRELVIQIDERTALHPALQPLMPLWQSQQLAIVQGVSYAQPNLSHFRSIEIWDTASRSDQYLREGWLTRAFAQHAVPPGFVADGVVIGSAEMGPLANGARAIALVNPAQFVKASRLATPVSLHERNPELAHILDVENDIVKAADRLRPCEGQFPLKTAFPAGAFGASIKTAMQVLATGDTLQGRPLNGQGGGRDPADAERLRYSSESARSAGRAAQAARRGVCIDEVGACRARALGQYAGDDLRRVRPSAAREPEQRHRSRYGRAALRHGWTGARRLVWRAPGFDATGRGWQLAGGR
jgi:uncharacterized protein (DUF1501 family)